MGKGGIVLGLIGLLLGAGGLGLGLINFMNKPVVYQPTVFYSHYGSEFYPSPVLTYMPITNISIVFDIGDPVSLHLIFTCSARCFADIASFSDLFFYFMINDVRQIDMPWARTGSHQGASDSDYTTVALQHYFTVTTPGTYNITVVILTEGVGNFIRESSLWIEAYPV
ncbi:MAG: hypothetical protein ACXABG_10960 [Promethearchaeota archaeon]|jgi:hypothetical protein